MKNPLQSLHLSFSAWMNRLAEKNEQTFGIGGRPDCCNLPGKNSITESSHTAITGANADPMTDFSPYMSEYSMVSLEIEYLDPKDIQNVQLVIEGIHCENCRQKIYSTLKSLPGVVELSWETQNQVAIQTQSSIQSQALISRIKDLGYGASLVN
ncbi:MAG: heavy-metal-associated domain-containing protein [Treponema sp.]|jgi:copper chaperone CopZ|nr:heavy-metal-associated domain-containing protein [Treponema sp.]